MAPEPGEGRPRPDRSTLDAVARSVEDAQDLESLTRPLLETLQQLSGLASTYLTVIDDPQTEQRVRYALNRGTLDIPEGTAVPWQDTLCRLSLRDDLQAVIDVPAVWGDHELARSIGVTTFVSVPVRLSDGRLWGTLCGADSASLPEVEQQLPTMRMFAKLIAGEIQRSRQQPDGSALDDWLRVAAAAAGAAETVAVVSVSLQTAEGVEPPAEVPDEVEARLRAAVRPGDEVVRTGPSGLTIGARVPKDRVGALVDRVRALASLPVHGGGRVVVRVGAASDLTDVESLPARAAAART